MKKILFVIIFLSINTLLVFCSGTDNQKLKITGEFKLKVPEPSGLALTKDGKHLWTVSDQNSTVYLISLKGKIEKKFVVNAEDLEGVEVINDSTLAVISERSGEILLLNKNGIEIARKKLAFDGKDNMGPEGISFNPKNNHYFIVKEKNPKILIELDEKFKEIKRTNIKFADDLSGLDFSSKLNSLWMISDESKMIAKCDVAGNILEKYKVRIEQIEGIAVDETNKKIYIVSDKEEKLYVLEIK
jgi:uncharacterized protein YjiK